MDGQVTVDEVLTMSDHRVGRADIATCAAGDASHDTQITINEIILAVQHALNGCGGRTRAQVNSAAAYDGVLACWLEDTMTPARVQAWMSMCG